MKYHYYFDGIGNHQRFDSIGNAIHFDSMGRRVNYVTVCGLFVRWIDN